MKRNIRKIPLRITKKMRNLNDDIVASCVKIFTLEQLENLNHLGIYYDNNQVSHQDRFMPDPKQGKFSNINTFGEEIKRKDLEKVTEYVSRDLPNWGDPWNGTHTVYIPYEKYPRDFIAPQHFEIKINYDKDNSTGNQFIFKFEVDAILSQNQDDFEKQLIHCLNLLQESIGHCDVANTDASFSDFTRSLNLSWEILPPGTKEEVCNRIFRARTPTRQERDTVEDRYDFLESLNPKSKIYGTSGMQRYFGALIRDDLVVFENVKYGNAIYIMFEDWEFISSKSRIELLSGRYGNNFIRIIHKAGWKKSVKNIINSR